MTSDHSSVIESSPIRKSTLPTTEPIKPFGNLKYSTELSKSTLTSSPTSTEPNAKKLASKSFSNLMNRVSFLPFESTNEHQDVQLIQNIQSQIPVLELAPFKPATELYFGNTYLHQGLLRHFKLRNPQKRGLHIRLAIESLNGLDFELFPNQGLPNQTEFGPGVIYLDEGESCNIPVFWTPTQLGKVRHTLSLEILSSGKIFEVVLLGQAAERPPPRSQRRISIRRSMMKRQHSSNQYVSNTQMSIHSFKKLKFSLEPSDRKQILQNWKFESNQMFIKVLDYYLNNDSSTILQNGVAKYMIMDRLLKAVNIGKRYQLESPLFQVLSTTKYQDLIRTLRFKSRVHPINDYNIRRGISDTLFNLNPYWLLYSLKTVFTKNINLDQHISSSTLKDLVQNFLFGNFTPETEVSQVAFSVMDHLLKIAIVLDHAMVHTSTREDPPLFTYSSKFLGTQDLIKYVIETYTKADPIGLMVKLGNLGVKLTYRQPRLWKHCEPIANLALDLRNGINLCKFLALHFNYWEFFDAINLTPLTQEHKLHNMNLCFEFMELHNLRYHHLINGPTKPIDIVLGDRPRSLGLLTSIFTEWKLPQLVNLELLEKENEILSAQYVEKFKNSPKTFDESSYSKKPIIFALFKWCHLINQFFNSDILNLTSSFKDPRPILYLFTHYFPKAFSVDEIQQDQGSRGLMLEDAIAENKFDLVHLPFKKIRQDPLGSSLQENYGILNRWSKTLGCLPSGINFQIGSEVDENLVSLYLAMLSEVMLRLHLETTSASKIQRVWRRHYQDLRRLSGIYDLAEQRSAAKKIQTWFKRWMTASNANACRSQFLCQKAAVYTIQDAWRVYLAKCQLKRLKSSVQVQSWWRMIVAARRYQMFKSSVIKIQSLYRGKFTRDTFLNLKQSSTALQALWRGRSSRRQLDQLKLATVTIQQFYRNLQLTRLTSLRYESLKYSAIIFQKYWRSLQAQRHLAYLKILSRFQALCRRVLVVKNLTRLNQSCIVIQRSFRQWKVKRGLKQELAVTQIQTWFRMNRQKFQFKTDLSIYRQTRHDAAVQIQKTFKMYQLRKKYLSVYSACRTIVAKWRAMVQSRSIYSQYTVLKHSTISLQRHWRNLCYTRSIRGQYVQTVNSATVIQKYFRRYRAQCKLIQLKSLVKLQALIRSKFTQTNFQILKRATTIIQTRRRALVLGRYCHRQYLSDRDHIQSLQTRWKAILLGRSVKQEYDQLKSCSIVIQAWWKGRVCQIQYQELQQTALKIQNWWRIVRCQQEYHERLEQFKLERSSAILIQSNFRRFIHQKNYLQLVATCRVVQSRRRAIVQCRDKLYGFNSLKNSTITIQRRRRATVLARSTAYQYQTLKNATIAVQSQIRRKRCQNRYLTQKSATITLQKNFRRHKMQTHYSMLKRVAYQCQLRVRANQLGRRIRNDFLRRKHAANTIRSYWLDYHSWKLDQIRRNYASIVLQSGWRALVARRQLSALRIEYLAATKIQSHIKKYLALKGYNTLRSTAITLQRRYRELLLTRQLHSDYAQLKSTTIACQRIFRSTQEMVNTQNTYHQLKSSTIFLQYTIRRLWKIRENRRINAIKIQTWWRCQVARNNYLHDVVIWRSIIKIQNWFRMVRDRSNYHQTKDRMIWLQQKWRSTLQSRIDQQDFVHTANACRVIQDRFRANQLATRARLNYSFTKWQSIKIQRWYRSIAEVRLRNAAAIKIQTLCLAYNAKYRFYRKQLMRYRWHLLFKRVQCYNILKANFIYHYSAIQHHQNAIKFKVLNVWREKCQDRLLEIRRQMQIQKENEAAIILQHHIRLFLIRCRFLRVCHSTYLLQRVIRGHFVRKRDLPDRRIRAIRRRIMKANAEATEEMKLCNRTTFALKAIAQSRCITTVMKACQHLVVVTRLSQVCRHRLLDEYKCVQIILELMKSCNRSTPHQEMLKPAVQILEHLSLDELGLNRLIRSSEQIGFILETMYFHNDLEYVLKGLLATLHHLMHSSTAFNLIKKTPDIKFKLRQIQNKMLRTQSRLSHLPKSRLSSLPTSYGRQSYLNRSHIGFNCHVFFSLPSMTEDKFEMMERVLHGLESLNPLTNIKN